MEKEIGEITHFFTNINVGIIKLSAPLKVGESIHVKGHTTDLTQTVDELQLDHKSIEGGKTGEEVGLKTIEHVREGDKVYRVA